MSAHGTVSCANSRVCASSPDTASVQRDGQRRGTFRALRHRNYRLFFLGQMVSVVGSWVQLTALMWLAFQLTGTSRWPALVAAAQLIPGFLLGAWGGALADRLPRRALIFQTQALLLVLALALTGLAFA